MTERPTVVPLAAPPRYPHAAVVRPGPALVAEAEARHEVDWTVSVDSTINRAHQHATTMSRTERPAGRQARGQAGGQTAGGQDRGQAAGAAGG